MSPVLSAVPLRAVFAVAAVTVFAPALSAQQAAPPAAAHAHHGAAAKPHADEDHARSGWAELDAFHEVMSAAWHPAKMDSLAPARASATTLVNAAKTWAKASVPTACDTPAIKAAVARLVPESEEAARLVASRADDATLKAALKTVHDTFHIVESGCKPGK